MRAEGERAERVLWCTAFMLIHAALRVRGADGHIVLLPPPPWLVVRPDSARAGALEYGSEELRYTDRKVSVRAEILCECL